MSEPNDEDGGDHESRAEAGARGRPHFWQPDKFVRTVTTTALIQQGEEEVEEGDDSRPGQLQPTAVRAGTETPAVVTPISQVDTTPPLTEMQAVLTYRCPHCLTNVETYHEVTTEQQLRDMCPGCNSRGFSLERRIRGTYKNEFAVEFVLVPHGAVELDDYGQAPRPFDRNQERSAIRSLVKVRRKYPLLGKTLVIQTRLDPGDREIDKMDVILVYLLRHEQRVAWADLRRNPTPALDENKSPFNASFEYHPE